MVDEKHPKRGKHKAKAKIPTKLVRKMKDFVRQSQTVQEIKMMLKGGEN
jgi:hypothetical protein